MAPETQVTDSARPAQLSMRQVLRVWWPLAVSWILMTMELPLISAVIARLAEPEINLAAWGVVFGLAIIIQSPSTMLLAASTALSKDWDSYQKLRRIMTVIGLSLTMLHVLIAFTPLYFVVVEGILSIPTEIVEPARLGLMLMTPWSWGTAYRRFQQGVMIQFGHSGVVIWGSLLRLTIDSAVLAVVVWLGGLPGIAVGAIAIIAGVLAEATYNGWRVQPVLEAEVKPAPRVEPALTLPAFGRFYLPLAITILLTLITQPLVSAALSRMPQPLESLAVWPVVFGFLIVWQSVGISYNEAVIALLDKPNAIESLQRVTTWTTLLLTGLLLLTIGTPLAGLWFEQVAALTPRLVELARQSLWLGLLLPGLRLWQSWYQGAITYQRKTRGITESVVIFLAVSGVTLTGGIVWGGVTGIYVGFAALTLAFLSQTLWLRYRSRPALQAVRSRDVERTVRYRSG